MPRPAKGIRLWLRRERRVNGKLLRRAEWIIRDGAKQISTGCGQTDRAGAEKALSEHLAKRYRPDAGQRDPDRLEVNDVLGIYGREYAPSVAAPERISFALEPLSIFWFGKTLGEIRGATCREYVTWRTSQRWATATKRKDLKVSIGTARRELECLQAAIGYYAAEYKLRTVPVVTLPEKPESRERWLTRSEAAAMIRAARSNPNWRHIVRFVLIGVYTGTRHAAMLHLKWMPSIDGGWVDLDAGLLYRRGSEQRRTKKRQPTSRIPPNLLRWLRRWKDQDDKANLARADRDRKANRKVVRTPCLHVISFNGKPLAKERRGWGEVRAAAKLGPEVTPHTLRHSAATWLMLGGADLWDAANYLGMEAMTLQNVYGHHHPDYQKDVVGRFLGAR
jgi:integrase